MATQLMIICTVVTLAAAKPIMVTFGTHQGPIVPPTSMRTPKAESRIVREPAPVSETVEDIPNPLVYRPMVPKQYREKIFQKKAPFGSPVNQGIARSFEKVPSTNGVEYTGPHAFQQQDYEFLEQFKRPIPVKYIKPEYYQHKYRKWVPQIGIYYSSGVRYYVPQFDYVRPEEVGGEEENSVYDKEDVKFSHH